MKPSKSYLVSSLVALFVLLLSVQVQAQENVAEIPDSTITKEVLKNIRYNLFYTVFDWVTVSTHNGVVTLKGYVDQPWDKKFFVNIAKKVDGVKSVTDKIEKVTGLDELRYKAARVIYTSPDFEKYATLKDPPVHIVVISNRVILEGKVYSNIERKWADALIEWHTDAFHVENNLKVEKG